MQLKIRNLSKTYANGVVALDRVTLNIPAGMFGLLGPNGAGKSTLMRILATLQECDAGSVFLDDIDVLDEKDAVRRMLGFTYWSLSAWAKLKVKNAVNFIGEFETTLAEEGRRREVDGVICGHIHSAAQKDFGGIAYLNTGDWVESCTALVEHEDGRMEVIRWAEHSALLGEQRMPAFLPRRRRAA